MITAFGKILFSGEKVVELPMITNESIVLVQEMKKLRKLEDDLIYRGGHVSLQQINAAEKDFDEKLKTFERIVKQERERENNHLSLFDTEREPSKNEYYNALTNIYAGIKKLKMFQENKELCKAMEDGLNYLCLAVPSHSKFW